MRTRRREAGFTLIEVVVVVAVIAILAALLTPYITKYIDDSKIAKARSEAKVIAAAVANAYKDLGRWPNRNPAGAPDFTILYTGTTAPAASFFQAGLAGWTLAPSDTVNNCLVANTGNRYATTGDNRWNGPYATTLPLDPWGNPYIINSANFTTSTTPPTPVWVLSAGPNGVINTPINNLPAGAVPGGDDIGFRIR